MGDRARPKGYLYVTATNLVRDRWRREQRDRKLQARLEETTPVSTPPCDPWLRDLVERLPERLRIPVLLHYYADMSVAEVAAALHKPEGTIKRMLYDARSTPPRLAEEDAVTHTAGRATRGSSRCRRRRAPSTRCSHGPGPDATAG